MVKRATVSSMYMLHAAAHLPLCLVRRYPKLSLCVVALYVLTGIGGWQTYVRYMQAQSEEGYAHYLQWVQRCNEKRAETDIAPEEPQPRRDGPHPFVRWCVPILPGVLMAKSGFTGTGRESDGERTFYENGGMRIVLYWGVGASEVLYLSQYFADGVLSEGLSGQ